MIIVLFILLTFLDQHYTRKSRYFTLPGELDIVILYILVLWWLYLNREEFVGAANTEKS